jgi:hypothetical protein
MGFHSCDKEIGIKVLNGQDQPKPSTNPWDWLGDGIYFWEQNPERALEYAIESSKNLQFNKKPIKTPFVIGAIIELGNCLNLVEPESLLILNKAYEDIAEIYAQAGKPLPVNKNNNLKLDAAVFKHLHKSRENNPNLKYDTIRCAFVEGEPIYPTANFSSPLHIQICVLNPELIRGYYLPRPIEKFNPFLKALP